MRITLLSTVVLSGVLTVSATLSAQAQPPASAPDWSTLQPILKKELGPEKYKEWLEKYGHLAISPQHKLSEAVDKFADGQSKAAALQGEAAVTEAGNGRVLAHNDSVRAHNDGVRAYGDVVRSYADYGRAKGDFIFRASQSQINHQTARDIALDNELKQAENFYAKRALHDQYQDRLKKRVSPSERQARAERISQQNVPQRLSPESFDPITGSLAWPRALRERQFDSLRGRVEQLLTNSVPRDRSSFLANLGNANQTVDEMESVLKKDVRTIPCMDYTQAKRFLRSLQFELHLAEELPFKRDALAALDIK